MPDGQKEFDRLSDNQGFSTPRPDPTERTKEDLRREIDNLRDIFGLQIAALDERLHAEIKLTDERLIAATQARNEIRNLIDRRTEIVEASFARIEERRIEQKRDMNTAIDAALKATEKAITESVKLTNAKIASNAESMDSLREMLNERYQTQTKALDAAFVAQQAAVATSFDASEKAMAAALLAAKEAVDKAAVSTEKRFDNVTELLAQQNAAMIGLLPRAEAEARMGALDARLTDIKSAVDKGFTGADMRSTVGKENWGYLVGGLGLLIAILIPIIVVLMTRSP